MLDFVREHKILYRQLVGTDRIAEAFGADQGLPTTFVIDGKGVILSKTLGSPPDKFRRLQKTVDAGARSDVVSAPTREQVLDALRRRCRTRTCARTSSRSGS